MLDYCKRQQNFNSSERPFKWHYFDFVVSPYLVSLYKPSPPWNYNPYVKRDSMPPRACRPTLRKGTWSLYMKSVDAHRLAINITNTNGPMQETKQIKEILMIIDFHSFESYNSFLIPKPLLFEQVCHTAPHQTVSLQIRHFVILFFSFKNTHSKQG